MHIKCVSERSQSKKATHTFYDFISMAIGKGKTMETVKKISIWHRLERREG